MNECATWFVFEREKEKQDLFSVCVCALTCFQEKKEIDTSNLMTLFWQLTQQVQRSIAVASRTRSALQTLLNAQNNLSRCCHQVLTFLFYAHTQTQTHTHSLAHLCTNLLSLHHIMH